MITHFEDELSSDYGVLGEKQGFLKELDEVVAKIDSDWGGATIDRDGAGHYEVALTYMASNHDEVFQLFDDILGDDRVDYESDFVDNRYVRYELTIDMDI